MGYSRKKPNRAGGRGELEEMEFPSSQGRGYWEKIQIGGRGGGLRIWNFQGGRGIKEIAFAWNFHGSLFLVLEFPRRDLT